MRIYRNQSNFLRTLKCHPEYAGYVQTLNWALVVLKIEKPMRECAYLPSYSKKEPLGIWEILPLLTEVISVRIEESETDSYPRAMIPQGLSLFPKVTSIIMSGTLTDTFVHAVLPIMKARQLQHLRLSYAEMKGPGRNYVEPTIKLLNSLTGRCTGLKILEIQDSEGCIFERCKALGEASVSTAYIKFLESVKETLVSFWFRCSGPWKGGTAQEELVMEMMHSINQIFKNKETWPRLQKVTTLPAIEASVSSQYNEGDSGS